MITVKTSNQLTVKFLPWFVWIVAGCFTLFSLPMFISELLQSIPKTLTCTRTKSTQVNCQFQNSNFPLLPSKTVVVKGLQIAKFTNIASKNIRNQFPSEIQQILLISSNKQEIFLSQKVENPQQTKQKMLLWESQINNFINNSQQQSLKLQIGNTQPEWFIMTRPKWYILVGVLDSLLILIFMGEISICEFERSRNYMTKKQRFLFIFTRKTKYSLYDIQDVQLEWSKNMGDTSRITITLNSGKKIPLSTYHANYRKSDKKMNATVEDIRNFLSLPTNS